MEGERRRKHCRISRPLINKLTKANLDINKDRQLEPRETETEERKRERQFRYTWQENERVTCHTYLGGELSPCSIFSACLSRLPLAYFDCFNAPKVSTKLSVSEQNRAKG